MKSIYLSAALTISLFTFNGCQNANNSTQIDYKYTEEIKLLTNCKLQHSDLINEAIYSFENDITQAYNKENKNPLRTYQMFLRALTTKTFEVEEIATAHSLKIAKALKETNYFKNGGLNLNSEVSECIFNNIKDKSLNTSLNALKTAESLRPNVVLPTLTNAVRNFGNDKHITAYLALEYFYKDLMLVNEKDLKTPITPINQKVDFNKVPRTIETPLKKTKESSTQPGHEGHNH